MRASNSTIQVGTGLVKWRGGHRSANFLLQSAGRGGRDFSQIAFYCDVRTGGCAGGRGRRTRPFPPSLPPFHRQLSLSPLHVTRTHAVVWYRTCLLGSCGVGLFAEKVISALSLSPSLVMHSMSSQPRPRSSPPLLICGPRRCGYDTRLLPPSWPSFGASLPFVSLSSLGPSFRLPVHDS